MERQTTGQSDRSANVKASQKRNRAEALMPAGSWQRIALGVAAAASGGLIAVSVLGVGPAAVAGAAGYLAYRGLTGRRQEQGRLAGQE
jgi:hypothetical protein